MTWDLCGWHSAVADYRLTGNEKSRVRGLHAASTLAGRFNPAGRYIPAWNGEDRIGWIIIDCMMNIPILYWATDELKDPRFEMVARAQADKELEMSIRPDGILQPYLLPGSDDRRDAGQPRRTGI